MHVPIVSLLSRLTTTSCLQNAIDECSCQKKYQMRSMVVKSGFSVNTSRAWVQFITPRSPRMFFLLKCFTEVVQFYNVSIWTYFYWTKLQLGLSNSSKTYTALSQGCFKYAMFHWIDAVKVLNSKYFHYETWRIIYCEYIFKAFLLQVFNHVEYCIGFAMFGTISRRRFFSSQELTLQRHCFLSVVDMVSYCVVSVT